MRLSILTVSKRIGWESRARYQLSQQDIFPVEGVEWIVVQEPVKYAAPQTSKLMNVQWLTAPEKLRRSNLNASLNEGLRHCSGEYVIFYQDFIDLPTDCLKKLCDLATPSTFVTTVTVNADGSQDPRYWGVDQPRPCPPAEWEANVAIAPLAVIKELGGFDEEYDNAWSWDNVNLAERAAMLGCSFILDESNRPQLLHHPKVTDMPLNAARHEITMQQIRLGSKPLRLPYMDETLDA